MKGAFRFPLYSGGSLPDPATYCPANGYLPPYQYYESPIEVDVVSTESIVFILDTEISLLFDNFAITSDTTCSAIFDFYDESNTLIETQTQSLTSAASYTISRNIPASSSRYVKCILTLNNGSAKIIRFASTSTSANGSCSVAIYANTPNLTYAINFRGHINLKKFELLSTLDFVPNLDYFFQTCGVERFTMPVSMPALTSMQYALVDSLCRQFLFPVGFSAPLLTNMFSFSTRLRYMESFALPDIPSLTSFNLGMYLSSIRVFTITGCENLDNISQIIQGNNEIEEITLPKMAVFTTGASLFNSCSNLKKLTLNGTWAKTGNDWIANCLQLRELHYPRTLSTHASSMTNSNTLVNLQILHVPDYFNFSATVSQANYYFYIYTGSFANKLKRIYGDAEFASGDLPDLTYSNAYTPFLEELNLPKLRVGKIRAGVSVATKLTKLTSINIDWANSGYGGTAPQITLAAALTATQLNAIFSALPTVSGKTIDVRYCDGYAACNKSIATAKGWTVS